MASSRTAAPPSGENAQVRHLGRGNRVRTPTHPTKGDYLSIKTEEVIFGILFAFMAWKLWQSVRGLFRYWKYVRAPNAPEIELEAGAIAFEEDDDENEKID